MYLRRHFENVVNPQSYVEDIPLERNESLKKNQEFKKTLLLKSAYFFNLSYRIFFSEQFFKIQKIFFSKLSGFFQFEI